jgi:hypothetical protein
MQNFTFFFIQEESEIPWRYFSRVEMMAVAQKILNTFLCLLEEDKQDEKVPKLRIKKTSLYFGVRNILNT